MRIDPLLEHYPVRIREVLLGVLLFISFLFYAFPSGLNLYYLCFNIMQILQQKIINNEASNSSSIGS